VLGASRSGTFPFSKNYILRLNELQLRMSFIKKTKLEEPTRSVQKTVNKSASKARKGKKPLSKPQYVAVKKLIDQADAKKTEKHYVDISSGGASISYSGTLIDLTVVAQGSTDSTRIGDSINLKSVQMKWTWSLGTTPNTVRLIVFQWFGDANVDAPEASEILQGSFVGGVGAPHAPYTKDSVGFKCQVVFDEVQLLDTYRPSQLGSFMITADKFRHKKIQYNGGGTTAVANSIWVLFISDDAAPTYPSIVYVQRTRFTG